MHIISIHTNSVTEAEAVKGETMGEQLATPRSTNARAAFLPHAHDRSRQERLGYYEERTR
jgi:hypothetical protein